MSKANSGSGLSQHELDHPGYGAEYSQPFFWHGGGDLAAQSLTIRTHQVQPES